MTPQSSERVVRRLDNPTAIASRLRWLAKQLMTEGGRPDQRMARPNLYQAARQLQTVANSMQTPVAFGDELVWVESATTILLNAIVERSRL